MLRSIKKTYNFNLILFLVMIYLFLASFLFATEFDLPVINIKYRQIILISLFAILLFSTIFWINKRIRFNFFLLFSFILTLYFLISAFIQKMGINSISNSLYFFIFACLAYNFGEIKSKKVFNVAVTAFILAFSMLYYIYVIKTPKLMGDEAVNSIYYLVCTIPILLMIWNKLAICVLSIPIIFIVCISGKGTAVLMLVACLLVLLVLAVARRSKFPATIIFVLLFMLGVIALLFVNESIFQEQSSGRLEIWSDVKTLYANGNPIQKLFGFGYWSVSKYTVSGYSAHSDYLEVLFDFGIIGFVIYILMIVALMYYAIKMYLDNSLYYKPFIVALIFFIVLSFSSHIILLPRYVALLAFTFGYCLRCYKGEKE